MQFNVDPEFRNDQDGNRSPAKVIIMDTCKELRDMGRGALQGKWLPASIVTFLLIVLVQLPQAIIDDVFGKKTVVDLSEQLHLGSAYKGLTYTVTQSPLSTTYALLVTGAIIFGVTLFFMKVFRKEQTGIGDSFTGFENYVRATGLFLYRLLFTIFWFIIPIAGIVLGPIAMIRYSQSYYIMIDHPEYPITVCVNESKRLMMGNKMKYFTLQLSFIGWYLLAVIPAVLILGFTDLALKITDSGVPFGGIMMGIIGVLELVLVYPVVAYNESTNVAFYEILTGKIKSNVYYPGMY